MATSIANVLFRWQDKYSVGIPQIDAQHQGLVGLINDFHTAMAAGHGKDAGGKILDELIRYTQIHFNYEESLLRQQQYSQLAKHQEIHRKLTAQVLELRERYVTGTVTLTLEVMQFLKNWLSGHIMGEDQKYAAEFKTR